MEGPADDGESAAGPGFRVADCGALARGRVHLPARVLYPAGQRGRPGDLRPLRREELPGLLCRVPRDAELAQETAHGPGLEQSAVLEVVRRRPAERVLQ